MRINDYMAVIYVYNENVNMLIAIDKIPCTRIESIGNGGTVIHGTPSYGVIRFVTVLATVPTKFMVKLEKLEDQNETNE